MWALKNSFLVSMSTMYLNFNRMKTRLKNVLHTLLICEYQRSLLSMVIPKRLIVQELCESRGGRPGLSVLTSLLVSVDVKIYCTVLRHWSQLALICLMTSEDIKHQFIIIN